MMKFKEVADALAKEQGLTNTEVAEMIGMSKANYSHEKGHNDNLSLYLKVCDALGAYICLWDKSGAFINKEGIKLLNTGRKNSALIPLKTIRLMGYKNACYSLKSKAGKEYNFTTINK